MQHNPFQRLRPGGQISARQFNEAMQAVEQMQRMRGDDETGTIWTGVTPSIANAGRVIVTIRILSGSNPYAWEKVDQLDEAGGQTWTADPHFTGTTTQQPAYERSGNTKVPAGAIVEAEYDAATETFSFSYDAIGVDDLADKLNTMTTTAPNNTASISGNILVQFFSTLSPAQIALLQTLIGGSNTFSGARVYSIASITVPSGSTQVLAYDTERFDEGGYWDAAFPSRLTVPAAGKYLIGFSHQWQNAGAVYSPNSYLRRGGVSTIAVDDRPTNGANGVTHKCETVFALGAGEYVEVVVNHNFGADQTIRTGSGTEYFTPEFWIVRLT